MTKKATMTAKSEATAAEAAEAAARLITLQSIDKAIELAYQGNASALKGEGTETKYIDMASQMGDLLHKAAKEMNWNGWDDMLDAIREHDSFRYFGNPYNAKLMQALKNGAPKSQTMKEIREKAKIDTAKEQALINALNLDLISLWGSDKKADDIITEAKEITDAIAACNAKIATYQATLS